ncbi:hypothetical protein BS17DRAFT_769087 [Gyrodon lividus]|nr:hypothetical protein BS17DRAFT_769087 [Gyrodon lividus]
MHSVISCFELNDHVYDSDKKKIITTLSFMNKGTAASWAEAYYEAAGDKGWGRWTDFIKNFKTTFAVSDVKGTALAKLTSLTQCHCGSLEKFNAEFRHLKSQSEKFISELQKNNVSEAEMLDVLKVCFENPKQDTPDALPIAKIGLDGQDF